MENKVVLITGASSGIGRDAAIRLAEQGCRVYAGARRLEKMEDLKACGIVPLHLDVADDASVQAAVDQVLEAEQRIDVLINNAGYGFFGAIEDVNLEDARHQFEVNVFGLANMTKKVLPTMRAQRSGRIVNISSMAGKTVGYLGGWYTATKFAVEALSDALRMETKEFGIDVVIVEPGGIKTDWGLIAADHLTDCSKGGAYETQAARVAATLRKQYTGKLLSEPKVISKAIARAVAGKRPKTRYMVGMGAKPLVFLHSVLPDRAFDWLMMHLL